uniref:Uncharacterized protein n=1 Tax=Globisporangium ultimum (strain ATCC 200006 / CBS 805.95 / DAOM BR144) TaxID=431595 RepID=K3WCD3_GLOUD
MAAVDSARSAKLQSLLARHRKNRSGLIERDIPFRWSRCFISVVSYALLLSDVLRSGLGAQTNYYLKLEPDRIMFFGPYAYPVAQIQRSQMVGTGTVWAYKFDSTSVAMRAYAEFFQLETWHSCLFYRARCPQPSLEASTIFDMLDSLVEVMASRRSGAMPHNLTLRTRNAWVDRIYHFILPQFFKKWIVRTNQALYYDSISLESPGFQFCSQNPVRPYACRDFWTNFSPICQESNLLCKDIGHLWDHILNQKQSLQDQFSNMTLDMLILESEEDFNEAAVSLQGKKLFDIAVIIRVQDCSSLPADDGMPSNVHNCSTIAVNEFRYEGASLTSTVASWYYIVATLRGIGQASVFVRAFVGVRTLFLIPSQVVIYGNLFPICCYVFAHLVDSAMIYQLVSQAFNTANMVNNERLDCRSRPELAHGIDPSLECESLDLETTFGMLDALVENVARHKSPRPQSRPKHMTLRTRNKFIDRLHHFILPFFFQKDMVRTNQALYYDAVTLRAQTFQFCAQNPVRPYACTNFWTYFAPNICRASTMKSLCEGIEHVFEHARKRIRSLQGQHSGMSIDLLLLESHDDHSAPAISFQGRKYFDVVLIARIRDCSTPSSASGIPPTQNADERCTTIAVDDFRYEGASLTSTVAGWYLIVSSIRAAGQVYAWIRFLMLYVGCFYARSVEPQYATTSILIRTFVAVRTMFLVPSQVVIYGSMFPICCYVVAHMLDSAMVYEIVAQAFTTTLGVFKLNLREFLRLSAVSMRNVWVLAFTLHVLHLVRSRRNWSPVNGIPGIPEFSISFISCMTILAQYRALSFRDSRVELISERATSARHAALRSSAYANNENVWGLIFLRNTLDAKCLTSAMLLLGLLLIATWCVLRVLHMAKLIRRIEMFFFPTTWVSYAAGALWPVSAFVVSWNGVFGARTTERGPQISSTSMASSARLIVTGVAQMLRRISIKNTQVSPIFLPQVIKRPSYVSPSEVVRLNRRNGGSESMIYLMNLAVMTDPLVLLRLRWWGGGKVICIYRSKATERLYFIPEEVAASHQDIPISWKEYDLLLVTNTMALPWWDLLQCG